MKTSRILSLILAFSMIMTSMFSVIVYAEEDITAEETVFVMTESHYNYQLLSKLGILPEEYVEYLDMTETMSRAFFAQVVVKMNGGTADEEAECAEVFTDVKEDTENYAYIEKAYESGIMNGYGDGNFYPDKAVTYGEFIKTMVNLLGGTAVADVKGGLYRGYYSVAVQSKIVLSKNIDLNSEVTIAEAVDIIVRTMSAPVFAIGSIGKAVTYEEGDTLFGINYDVYSMEGIVNAVYGYDIYGLPDCEINSIEINNYNILCDAEEFYEDFLGKNATCYYVSKKGKRDTVVHLIPKDFEEITLSGRVIRGKSETGTTIIYENENKVEKKLNLSPDACLVYNGVAHGNAKNIESKILFSENADITFLDNNTDGKYDVVFVWEYEFVKVLAYNKKSGVVYFEDGSTYKGQNSYLLGAEIEDEIPEFPCFVYVDGELSTKSAIRSEDILSIAESVNTYGNKTITLYVSRDEITGTANTIEDDKVVVKLTDEEIEKEFYIASNFDDISAEAFDLGKESKYTLNHRGEIVEATAASTSSENVSYLTHIGFIKDGFSTRIGFKMFKKNSKFETFEGAEKITLKVTVSEGNVEETVYKPEKFDELKARIMDVLRGYDPATGKYDEEWCGGLCKYTLNEDERLDSIHISYNLYKNPSFSGSDSNIFSLDYTTDYQYIYASWLNAKVWLISTECYYVPNKIFNENVDEDAYAAGYLNILGGRQTDLYNVKIYDLDENELSKANYLVSYYDASNGVAGANKETPPLDNNVMLISGVTIVANDDGPSYKVTGMYKGSSYQCLIPTDDELPKEQYTTTDPFGSGNRNPAMPDYTVVDLEYGDIIQPSLDAMNRLTGFRVLYKKSRDEGKYFDMAYDIHNDGTSEGYNPMEPEEKNYGLYGIYGEIVDVDKKAGTISVKTRESDGIHSEKYFYTKHHVANYGFLRYKFEDGKVQTVAASEFEIGDIVFIRGRWNEAHDSIIIRD